MAKKAAKKKASKKKMTKKKVVKKKPKLVPKRAPPAHDTLGLGRRRRPQGIGTEEKKGATVPMWAAMLALIGTAVILGRGRR